MHVALIEFRQDTPYPVQLANALAPLCSVTLMLPDTASDLIQKVEEHSLDLQLFHMPRYREPANLTMVQHLRSQIRALQPDLLHITFWNMWGTPGLGLFAPLPLVATVHDVSRHPGDYSWWKNPSVLFPLQWRWADQVIVHANNARQKLISQHHRRPESVHVIPIGVYDFYRAWADTSQVEEPNTILFFGRIWEYKGLQCLIEAEPIITREVPDARIVIAGYGEPFGKYRKAMVNPEKFEVRNRHIPNREVAALFQSASVVVLPYLEASQTGVIPIAYAFGKPVVATTVGGIPEVVDHDQTGLLVPPGDPRSLAEAIITLLQDREARTLMGRRAQEKTEKELSWSSIAEQTIRVYEKALASS